MIEQMNRTLGL